MVTHGSQPQSGPDPGAGIRPGHAQAPSAVDPAAQTTAPAELPPRVAVVRMPLLEFAKRAGLVVGMATLAVGAILLLWIGAASLIALLFAGVLLGVLLRAMANAVGRVLRIGPGWSLAVVMLSIAGAAAAGVVWVAPEVVAQVEQISRLIPRSLEGLERRIGRYQFGAWLMQYTPGLETLAPQPGRVFDRVTGLLAGTFGLLVSVLVVVFVGVYLAATPKLYVGGIVSLAPVRHRERARELMGQLYETLKWWLIGKGIAMAVVGVLTWVGLWAVGMELAFTLAVFTALMEFIPNFGPYIGAAPALLVAAAQGPEMVLWVVGVYVIVQTIEAYILTPIIQQKTVHLPPALTIAAQLILGVLLGAIGVIIAAPATAAGMVIVKELYVKGTLGDQRVDEEREVEREGGGGGRGGGG